MPDPLAITSIGALSGFLVGLTGVGGSALTTPLLLLVGLSPRVAVATDLAFAALTKSAGLFSHHRQNNVDWLLVRNLALGSVPASLGVLLLPSFGLLDDAVRVRLLAVVLFFAAACALLRTDSRDARTGFLQRGLWRGAPRLALVGVLVGTLVALTSVGSGCLVMALLMVGYGATSARLVGSDVAHGALIATIDTLIYGARGAISLPVLSLLLLGSLPAVFCGVLLHRTAEDIYRRSLADAGIAVRLTEMEQMEGLMGDIRIEQAVTLLSWAARSFGQHVKLACAFNVEDCVLIDLIARRELKSISLFTLDTSLLFDETRALWRDIEQRYGVTVEPVKPPLDLEQQGAQFGETLWQTDPERCCQLRKVDPLAGVLAGKTLGETHAWITGIRREHNRHRATASAVEWDSRFALLKLSPLVEWSTPELWQYVETHAVPVNALHQRGYLSIGCRPCTSPVAAGEDPRAGRWRGRQKTECGLHPSRRAGRS
jgi:phosphoadenosine phosphosulfate reductase